MRPEFAARARVGFLAANWTPANSNTTWPSVKFTKWIFYYIFPLLCLYYGILFSWELLDMIPFYYALYYIEFSLTFPIILHLSVTLDQQNSSWPFFPLFGPKRVQSFIEKFENSKQVRFYIKPFFTVFSFGPENNFWNLPNGPLRLHLLFFLQEFSELFS